MSENASTTQGLTRRELLKRGAALGGALAWATPAVQMIGMQSAMAQVPSHTCLCIKLSACNHNASWQELGTGGGNCTDDDPTDDTFDRVPIDCDTGFDPDPSDFLVGSCTDVGGNKIVGDDKVCIEFGDGSATLFVPGHCTILYLAEKGGSDTCTDHTPLGPGDFNADGSYTFPILEGGGEGCSHIELCLQC